MTKNSMILDNRMEFVVSKYRYDEVREQYLEMLKKMDHPILIG